MSVRRTYRIRGLDCAEEISVLRNGVEPLGGVQGLDFNLLEGTMTVSFDPAATGEEQILAAVRKTGLQVIAAGDSCAPGVCTVEAGFWSEHGRALVCGLSGLLLAAGFAVHVVAHGWLHALGAAEGPEAAHVFPPLAIWLYVLSAIAGAWFVLPKALAALRSYRADMNLLMTIAVLGAFGIQEWFEAAAVAFLFSFSLLLESWSVGRARTAISSLLDIAPLRARLLDDSAPPREVPVAQVTPGARIAVRPGEKIPLDGVILRGSASVNQAPITGESVPVLKEPGDALFAGTINETGSIEMEVTRPADDTTLSRIIRMVEEAHSRRAPAEQWVERFARVYTPVMIALALLIAIVPPLVLGGGWGRWFYQALVVLVIACPCALVISTPVTIVAALTSAARAGVLIKGGAYLEAAGRLRTVALDKTGTVTHGRPAVRAIVPLDGHSTEQLLRISAAIEAHSEHPLARAVLERARLEGVAIPAATEFQSIKGKGAEALVDGRHFWLGSHRFMHEKGMDRPDVHQRVVELEDAGHSVVALGNDEHVCGLISIADTVRDDAGRAVLALHRAGVRQVVMLTGDNEGTARAVARAVGIDSPRAELLPEDKLRVVEELARESNTVGMVGDGVNDAPALAAATVGIAMGAAGTDAAIETADVALMSDDLMRLPWLVLHARRALRVVKQNIAFAIGVKALFMALALADLATLWMAIAADMGASLIVIFSGLRLLRGRDVPTADNRKMTATVAPSAP